jgi:hypothetical protein
LDMSKPVAGPNKITTKIKIKSNLKLLLFFFKI